MQVKFIKPFRHVVGTDIHATEFTRGDVSDDERTCTVALAEGVAEKVAGDAAAGADEQADGKEKAASADKATDNPPADHAPAGVPDKPSASKKGAKK